MKKFNNLVLIMMVWTAMVLTQGCTIIMDTGTGMVSQSVNWDQDLSKLDDSFVGTFSIEPSSAYSFRLKMTYDYDIHGKYKQRVVVNMYFGDGTGRHIPIRLVPTAGKCVQGSVLFKKHTYLPKPATYTITVVTDRYWLGSFTMKTIKVTVPFS